MRKKLLKVFTIGTLALSMILNTGVHSQASDVGMRILKSHHNNKIIKLRDRPIKVPEQMIQREEQFRGVWVSTVYNLDFPSEKGMSKANYKAEYIKLLDNLEDLNMNSLIFQVRPKLDAFYKSDINPWSEYLTGKQGKAPNWDPMEWMIEETHRRGMEFHAWFNPYRVTTAKENEKSIKEQLSGLSEKNWARRNPEYVYRFDGRLYLNPGEPEVIEHINKTVMEVVENYDIDAVHFDDYFYPFKRSKGLYFQGELRSFEKHKDKTNNVDEWRRNNIDSLVEKLHTSIEGYNEENGKAVQFGISPFAIWGHKNGNQIWSRSVGSHTPLTSSTSYDNQFADTRKWVKNNWVDYIAPQAYWTFDEKAAPYGELVHWWTEVVKDTDVNLYIGHANYRINESSKNSSWKNPEEICNQLKFNSQYDEIKGSIFFRYKYLLKTKGGNTENDRFISMLEDEYFKDKAKLPSKHQLKEEQIAVNIREESGRNIIDLKDNMEGNHYYIVYREVLDDNGKSVYKVQVKTIKKEDGNNHYSCVDENVKKDAKYKYSIVNINRDKHKSKIAYIY